MADTPERPAPGTVRLVITMPAGLPRETMKQYAATAADMAWQSNGDVFTCDFSHTPGGPPARRPDPAPGKRLTGETPCPTSERFM
jgi:hypothetical protein